MVAEIESSASMTVEGREGHVQSVMNAKSTLGPSSRISDTPRSGSGSGSGSASNALGQARPSTRHPTSLIPTPTPSYPAIMHGHVDGPPVTQPSSISVSTGSMGRQSPSTDGGKRTAAAAAIGVFLGMSVLGTWLFMHNKQKQTANQGDSTGLVDPSPTGPTEVPTTPTMTATPTPTVPIIISGPVVEYDDAGALAAHPVQVKNTPTSTPHPKANPTPKPIPSATSQNNNTQEDCSTPFWFDAAGVKLYKPHCLDKKN
jgi:hypothetical protein